MAEKPGSSLIPPQPIPLGAYTFSERVSRLMDGRPKDDATVAQALAGTDDFVDEIAARLYTLASMLVGEGETSVRLVETAIANADASAACDPVKGRRACRRALCAAAIESIARRNPRGMAAPDPGSQGSGCIEKEDLDAAAESRLEFERMIAGSDRERVRRWLADLPVALRTVFVLRVAAGFSAQETAELLALHGGPQAAEWSADAVRETFRQALCLLASQLLQATVQSAGS